MKRKSKKPFGFKTFAKSLMNTRYDFYDMHADLRELEQKFDKLCVKMFQ